MYYHFLISPFRYILENGFIDAGELDDFLVALAKENKGVQLSFFHFLISS